MVVPNPSRNVRDYSELPEPIRLEDTVATQETRDAPDPYVGHDTETEFMLRHAG